MNVNGNFTNVSIKKPEKFSELTKDYIMKRYGDRATETFDPSLKEYRVDVYKKQIRDMKIMQENYETPITYFFNSDGKVCSRTLTVKPSRVFMGKHYPVPRKTDVKTGDRDMFNTMFMRPSRRTITTEVIDNGHKTTVFDFGKRYAKVIEDTSVKLGDLRARESSSTIAKLKAKLAPIFGYGSNNIIIDEHKVSYAFEPKLTAFDDADKSIINVIEKANSSPNAGRIIIARGDKESVKMVTRHQEKLPFKIKRELGIISSNPIKLVDDIKMSIQTLKVFGVKEALTSSKTFKTLRAMIR